MKVDKLREKVFRNFLLLAVSLSLVSCSNLFGSGDSGSSSSDSKPAEVLNQPKTITVTGDIKICEELTGSGAIPEEYRSLFSSINNSDNSQERTAFPTVPTTGYYVTATDGDNTVTLDSNLITTTANGASFSMTLSADDPDKVWTVEAGIKAVFNGSEVVILKDTFEVTTPPTFYHEFVIKPLEIDENSKGNVDLTITYETSEAQKPDKLEIDFGDNTTQTIDIENTETETKIILNNKKAGSYKAKLVFRKNGYVVYTDYQGINIFPNMTTNTWVSSGGNGPVTGSTYKLTDTLVQDYLLTQIYVGSTSISGVAFTADDTTGNGTVFAPFETFAKAIDYLQKNGDTSKAYTIWFSGEITGAQTISDGTESSPTPVKASSLTISGVTGNTSDSLKGGTSGSVLLVDTEVPVTIINLKITGGKGTSTVISGTTSKLCGGGLNVKSGSVTLSTGAWITGNHAEYGGGVFVASGAKLFMSDNSVVGDLITNSTSTASSTTDCSNYATTYGGGIYVNGGELYLGYTNGTTPTLDSNFTGGVNRNFCPQGSNTSVSWGGGIYFIGSTFKMSNGTVSYNYAYMDGGGLTVSGENTNFYFSGGNISNNTARNQGGGIFLRDKANIFMSGNALIGDTGTDMTDSSKFSNKVTSDEGKGGGLYAEGAPKLYLGYTDASHTDNNFSGGICHNYSKKYGGAIYITNTEVYMAKGIINYNSAEDLGGGIYLVSTLNLTGGTFTSNKCGSSGNGGAIYFGSGNFNFNGGATFTDPSTKDNDIYISSNLKLTFSGTETTGSAVITPSEWTRGKQIFAAGSGVTITDDMLAQFSLTDSDWKIVLQSSVGKLDADIYVSGTSANDTNGDGTASNPYGTLATAISKCWDSNKDYTIYVKGTLTGNQEISGTITAKSITLQGAGTNPSIDANQNGRPLLINTSKEVTIKGLAIKNGKLTSGDGGGISVAGGCTLTLDSGAQILSNDNYTANTSGKGGGIYIAASNTVIMKSGSLVNLNKAYQGGGIYNEGKLLMYGTARIGTTATSYPQNPWATPPRTQTGNCSYDNGGGVYNKGTLCLGYSSWTNGLTNQTANLTAGITGNFSKGQGGGVYINTSANLYFNTGNISYNRSSDRGAGVYIYSGFMTMSGGSMTSNCHDGNLSGAIHVNGTLNMSGSVSIPYGLNNNDGTWNTSGAKNNLYVDSGKIIGIADGFANSDQTIEMTSAVTSDGTQLLDLSSNSSPVTACTFFSIGTGKVINREGKIESGYVVTASTVAQVLNDITSGSTLVVRASNVTDIATIAAAIKNKPEKTVSLSLTQILSNSLLTLDFEDTCSFMDCTNITSVTIDGSKIRPHRNAFGNCINLTTVTVVGAGNVRDWGSWSFKGCTSLTTFDFTECESVYLNGGSLTTNGGSANSQTTTIIVGPKLKNITFSNMALFTNPNFALTYTDIQYNLTTGVSVSEYEAEGSPANVKVYCSDGTYVLWRYESHTWLG